MPEKNAQVPTLSRAAKIGAAIQNITEHMPDIPFSESGKMVLATVQQSFAIAVVIAESGLAPSSFENDVTKIQMALWKAQALQLDPLQGLEQMAVIRGRVTMWGDLLPALAKTRGGVRRIKRWYEIGDKRLDRIPSFTNRKEIPDDLRCCVQLVVNASGGVPAALGATEETEVFEYSVAMSKMAGLWGDTRRKPWQDTPLDMLYRRALSRALKTECPEIFFSIIDPDEALDLEPVETQYEIRKDERRESKAGLTIAPAQEPGIQEGSMQPATQDDIDKSEVIDHLRKNTGREDKERVIEACRSVGVHPTKNTLKACWEAMASHPIDVVRRVRETVLGLEGDPMVGNLQGEPGAVSPSHERGTLEFPSEVMNRTLASSEEDGPPSLANSQAAVAKMVDDRVLKEEDLRELLAACYDGRAMGELDPAEADELVQGLISGEIWDRLDS